MSGTEFTIGGVSDALGAQLDAERNQLGEMMNDYDPDDPMSAFRLEMEVAEYKAEMSLMSALVKDLSEIQQQIIQKI